MEHLNKQQLILLALLISFVSSIATAIVTVTLMQQAPPIVQQGINQVVQKTIEKIIPIKGPTVTETRIVNQEDLIVAVISKNTDTVVAISTGADPATGLAGDKMGTGVFLTDDGYIVTDGVVADVPEAVFFAQTTDGKIYELTKVLEGKGVVIFKPVAREKEKLSKFTPVSFGDANQVKVGQFAISLGDLASTGIVSGLSYESISQGTSTPSISSKTLSLIHVTTNSKDTLGSAVLNLNGSFIGMVGSRAGTRTTIPSNIVKDMLSQAQATVKK